MNEQISAFLDGEADRDEAVEATQRLGRDANRRQAWARYHLIGAAIRNEPAFPCSDLHERISQEIANEPTQLAPRSANTGAMKRLSSKFLPLAVAASIGALAVVGFQARDVVDPANRPQLAKQGLTRWQTPQPEMETTLNAFLVEHGEFTSASGMNGLISYAKFVSYDADQ